MFIKFTILNTTDEGFGIWIALKLATFTFNHSTIFIT